MRVALLHRRLTILMGLAGLLAFAAGAGFEPVSAALACMALVLALFWQPSAHLSVRLEPVWLPIAALLVARAMWHVLMVGDDVVIPVVDLLLLLLCAESLRSLDAPNDTRLYALSFALLLASTAYRPGIVFVVAFVAYVTLATVALTVGHLRRKSLRHRAEQPRVDRVLIGATAGLGTVVLVTSALVFLAFPRVTRGFAGRGDVPATQVTGFSDEVSIGEFGSQIYANPQIVLRVEFPEGPPADMAGLYWRGRSFDRFDGTRWRHSFPTPPANAPRSWYPRALARTHDRAAHLRSAARGQGALYPPPRSAARLRSPHATAVRQRRRSGLLGLIGAGVLGVVHVGATVTRGTEGR